MTVNLDKPATQAASKHHKKSSAMDVPKDVQNQSEFIQKRLDTVCPIHTVL